MKKLLLILPFLAVISCAHENQKVTLNFDLNNQSSTIGRDRSVVVAVLDERANKNLLGRKKFSEQEIEISPYINLANFLQPKIIQNLMRLKMVMIKRLKFTLRAFLILQNAAIRLVFLRSMLILKL